MNTKDLIIQELEATPEPLLNKILDFVRFLKIKQTREAIEDRQYIEDSQQALIEAEKEGSISLESFKKEVINNDISEKANKQNKYDFSDLKGKLSWQGEAVTVQRQLRDEW